MTQVSDLDKIVRNQMPPAQEFVLASLKPELRYAFLNLFNEPILPGNVGSCLT